VARKPAASLAFLVLALAAWLAPTEGAEVELRGFVLGVFTGRTTGLTPTEGSGDFVIGEERVRLDVQTWSGSTEAGARVKADLLHDALADAFDLDLREAYVEDTRGGLDLRLGRQIVTWGVGDLLFVNDVFPKDWVSFFGGRPLEYLKMGIDGLRVGYTGGRVNAELVASPFFRPDAIPDATRFFLCERLAGGENRVEILPETRYENVELALRLYGRLAGFDAALYAYRGFWGTPGARRETVGYEERVVLFHPRLSVYGASAQGSAVGGVLSLEAGLYDSREDREGHEASIPNSQVRFLVGYERQLAQDFVVSAQYYAEIMLQYDAYRTSVEGLDVPLAREYRDVLTLRLDRRVAYETWTLGLFAFVGIAERDYLLQPRISRRVSDELLVTLGGNVFGGRERGTFFGQLDRNDNVYLSVRFSF
jgi:hypothetical protein